MPLGHWQIEWEGKYGGTHLSEKGNMEEHTLHTQVLVHCLVARLHCKVWTVATCSEITAI